MKRLMLAGALAVAAVAATSALPAAAPALTFTTFAHTDLGLGEVNWIGTGFLYAPETLNVLEVADATGANARTFSTFDGGIGGEEIRCIVPPNKYWPDGIYCHTPDNRIVRIARDGSSLTLLAQLPASGKSDGALVFDSSGKFGYALLAATGTTSSDGGRVFAVRKDGRVQAIGDYPGPGGADEIAIAPARFGAASGLLLVAVDDDVNSGALFAIDRKGKLVPIATDFGNGLNPIVVIPPAPATRAPGLPPAGLYVSDTNSQDVFFAPASSLTPYAGQVLVGSELGGQFWLVRPNAFGGFVTEPVAASLPAGDTNLEFSVYVP